MTRTWRVGFVSCLAMAWMASPASAQQDRWLDPGRIANLANPAVPFPWDLDHGALLARRLQEPDPLERRSAIQAITSRLGTARMRGGPDAAIETSPERQFLHATRPVLESALTDADETVRQAAVEALAALGLRGSGRAAMLDAETLQTFAEAFASESSERVRVALIDHATTPMPASPALQRQLVTAALESDSPAVLAAALRAAGSTRVPGTALARAVALLDHASRDVRLAAAHALAAYGERARPYLAAIRRANARGDVAAREALGALERTLATGGR